MIGMFDSGLGGLSVWRELARQMPGESVIYLADRDWCPYGPRSHGEIEARSIRIAQWLFDQGASSLVIACNTATSAAAASLRARYPHIPIIGMEPAIKPAALASLSSQIAVLATRATLSGDKLQHLALRYHEQTRMTLLPGDGFVEQVEAGDLDSPATQDIVRQALAPLTGSRVDQIVLGCTHYPFLAPQIAACWPDAALIDPAGAVCRQIRRLLQAHGLSAQAGNRPHYRFVSTAAATDMERFLSRVLGLDAIVESVALP
ncbi:glutamate racemase [Craterilacuibacter sp.]|uniref:glutamate racemase n=1 Tax=Craterilacuibacter sp. TaxID=2870909 RepID=UPI003F2F29A0